MMYKKTVLGLIAATTMGITGAAVAADQTFITIGTGGVTGVYYPTGGAICRLVNKDRKTHGIRCSVESTGGSVYNARTIRQGELDFGVMQSDVQAKAVAGVDAFIDDGPDPKLRSVFSNHGDPLHIMARADSGITSIADMKGKRVNIGNLGSGQRSLAETIMKYEGLTAGDFKLAAELKSSEQSAALCDGKVQAVFWSAAIPNGSTLEATSSCDVNIVDMTSSASDKILADYSYYAGATIPGGTYSGNPDDVWTWGPKATFTTSADVPDDVVYAVVSAVFDNFSAYKKLHPAFANLKESDMISDGLTAPIHPGALKYYKERGWK